MTTMATFWQKIIIILIREKMNKDEFTTWSVYDSMIQSYRSSMIASQALLLAVEAITLEKLSVVGFFVCIIGLIQLCFWCEIIKARAIISDFHKFNALYEFDQKINIEGNKMSEGDKPLTEDIYVESKSIRDRANSNLAEIEKNSKLKSNCRPTRRKLAFMPVSFGFIWGIFFYCIYAES